MNTDKAVTDERIPAREYQAVVWLDKDDIKNYGLYLLGGQKEVRSIFFDSRDKAQSWLQQCVTTNRGLSSLKDSKIHARIKESAIIKE